jgi:PAS domain S-box-containing protein
MNRPLQLRWPTVIIGVLLFALIMTVMIIYRNQESALQNQAENELAYVTQLKVEQIADWRQDQLEKGWEVMERPLLYDQLVTWLTTLRPDASPILLAEFEGLRRYNKYDDIVLVDVAGNIRFSLSGAQGVFHEEAALESALRNRRPTLGDLHISEHSLEPHISVCIPLIDAAQTPVGALIFVINARSALFPLIQSPSVMRKTMETKLVRRNGDSALILNDLRLRPDPALTLRLPLTRTEDPSVMAVSGIYGLVRGRDYRDVEVLAYIQPIPDSEWFLVTKIDASEVFAEMNLRAGMQSLLALSVITLVGLLALVVWQRQRHQYLERLYDAERAQHASDLRYRITLQSIGDAVIATDATGRITLLNPVAEAMTGWSNEEAQNRPLEEVFQIVNEETLRPAENPVARVLREGRVVGLANHTLLIDRLGRRFPIADTAAPIRDEDGGIQGVVLVFRDQSAERAAQRALEESEARIRGLISAIPDHIFRLDRNYRFLDCWVNDDNNLLVPREQFLGKTTFEVMPWEVAEGGARALDRALETGVMQIYEYSLDTPDGVGWYEQRLTPISADEVIAITRDVTERKRREQVTRLRLALLEFAAEHSYHEVLTKALEEICALVDSASGLCLAVESDRRALSLQAWHPPTLHSQASPGRRALRYPIEPGSVWAQALASRSPTVHEGFARLNGADRDDSGERIASERQLIAPVIRQEKVVALLSVCNKPTPYMRTDVLLLEEIADMVWEIAERKRMEESERTLQERLARAQKLEAIGQLAGGVAHDFNNMLAVILMRSELALQKLEPSSPLHRHLTEIHKTAQRSAELTRQLLGFARKQIVMPRVLDLNAEIAASLSMVRSLVGEAITVEWLPQANLWPVRMDPSQLNQILVNLCVNARDAIDGIGKIVIRTENSVLDALFADPPFDFSPGEYVLLTISDDGCGMSREVLAHLFEPFFTTKELGKGTGLGLATVYGIVRQNQGYIQVYSEVGVGTTFKIYFPRYSEAPLSTEAPSDVVPQGAGEVILLVEDEPAVLEMAAESLRRLGYAVLTAATPSEALNVAATHPHPIDLLITDVVMPEMNGRQLAAEIALHQPRIRRLFISGYPADFITHRAVLDEREQVLAKPFSFHQLAEAVRRALSTE